MNIHQRETTLPTTRRFKPSFWRTWRPSDSWGRRTRHWMKDWPRPTPWVRMSSIKHHIRLCPCEEKKNLDSSWCLAPQGDERLIREAFGNRGAEIEAYRSMSGKARGYSSYLFIIYSSFYAEADYFTISTTNHTDSLLVFLSLTNLLARLPWRRWTRKCCPREKSSTP